jgi:hypothetical protein
MLTGWSDAAWDSVRNGLIAIGTLTAATGWFDVAQVEPFVNNFMAIGGLVVTVSVFAWTIKVRFGTRGVPIEVARREDVPTVSPITGAIEHGRGA